MITAGPTIRLAATMRSSSATVPTTTTSSARVPFSTMAAGVAGSMPCSIRRRATVPAVDTPMYTTRVCRPVASAAQSRSGSPDVACPVTKVTAET